MSVYLDANASESARPEARTALIAALDAANPASIHRPGRAARRVLEDARETIAAAFGARPDGVVFTSGGTEANALGLAALAPPGGPVLVGATEHDAVRAAAPDADILPVDRDGRADLAVLSAWLGTRDRPATVALMLANNETGVIHPIAEIAALCRQAGARLHVDAVQAAGRMPIDLAALGADMLAISAHKLGGPQGAGALLIAAPARAPAPILRGGGQERGWRGGTPGLPAIAGFAAATRAALAGMTATNTRLAALRDAVEAAARKAGALVCGAEAPRIANTACLAWPGHGAEAQVIALDLAGYAVSAGAACSAGKVATSPVLTAMGLGPLAGQAIRVSLPWNTTDTDIEGFIAAYRAMLAGQPPGRAAA